MFEKSAHADPFGVGKKFRLKDIGVLRRLAPGVYESAAGEVKEHNDYVFAHGGKERKYKLGKKLGSIPLWDASLHPELSHDKRAQEKYWQEHPEMKCR